MKTTKLQSKKKCDPVFGDNRFYMFKITYRFKDMDNWKDADFTNLPIEAYSIKPRTEWVSFNENGEEIRVPRLLYIDDEDVNTLKAMGLNVVVLNTIDDILSWKIHSPTYVLIPKHLVMESSESFSFFSKFGIKREDWKR